MGKTKSITFRPTEKSLEKIQQTMKEKKIKRSKAINIRLERELTEHQLEHSEGGIFLELPPFLRCQDTDTETWLPTKECVERCKICNIKKFCEAWTG